MPCIRQCFLKCPASIAAIQTERLQRKDGSLQPVPGSECTLTCDMLLIAAGFTSYEEDTVNALGLSADARGRLMPMDQSHYLGGNLFSAGDMRTGPSLVVRALSDGRAAAAQIDSWPKRLPRR